MRKRSKQNSSRSQRSRNSYRATSSRRRNSYRGDEVGGWRRARNAINILGELFARHTMRMDPLPDVKRELIGLPLYHDNHNLWWGTGRNPSDVERIPNDKPYPWRDVDSLPDPQKRILVGNFDELMENVTRILDNDFEVLPEELEMMQAPTNNVEVLRENRNQLERDEHRLTEVDVFTVRFDANVTHFIRQIFAPVEAVNDQGMKLPKFNQEHKFTAFILFSILEKQRPQNLGNFLVEDYQQDQVAQGEATIQVNANLVGRVREYFYYVQVLNRGDNQSANYATGMFASPLCNAKRIAYKTHFPVFDKVIEHLLNVDYDIMKLAYKTKVVETIVRTWWKEVFDVFSDTDEYKAYEEANPWVGIHQTFLEEGGAFCFRGTSRRSSPRRKRGSSRKRSTSRQRKRNSLRR